MHETVLKIVKEKRCKDVVAEKSLNLIEEKFFKFSSKSRRNEIK